MGKTGKAAALVAICLFAFVMRGAFMMLPVYVGFDAKNRYVPQAKNLLAGNGFSRSNEAPYKGDTFEHSPGYAFFLAGSFFVSNYSLRFLAIVQMILELLTIYLTWLIAGLLRLDERAKRMVIITALLCPLLAKWAPDVTTEILATFFITLALYLVLLSIQRKRTIFWIAAGLASGCAWFARTDQVLIIFLLVLSSAILSRKIVPPLLLALTFFAATLPWTIRNFDDSGNFGNCNLHIPARMDLASATVFDCWPVDSSHVDCMGNALSSFGGSYAGRLPIRRDRHKFHL